jgi:hypothetical protein
VVKAGSNGNGISNEAKLDILWRVHERSEEDPPPSSPSPTFIAGIPDRLTILILIGMNALGLGPGVFDALRQAIIKIGIP